LQAVAKFVANFYNVIFALFRVLFWEEK